MYLLNDNFERIYDESENKKAAVSKEFHGDKKHHRQITPRSARQIISHLRTEHKAIYKAATYIQQCALYDDWKEVGLCLNQFKHILTDHLIHENLYLYLKPQISNLKSANLQIMLKTHEINLNHTTQSLIELITEFESSEQSDDKKTRKSFRKVFMDLSDEMSDQMNKEETLLYPVFLLSEQDDFYKV
jgi:iron-sulfur cluster repair protein YtfE (RIC family)